MCMKKMSTLDEIEQQTFVIDNNYYFLIYNSEYAKRWGYFLKMELIDVPQRHQFNIDNLYQYLVDQLGGFKCTRGNLTVRQFT